MSNDPTATAASIALAIIARDTVLPATNSRFVEKVETPAEMGSTFQPSKLDVARWDRIAKGDFRAYVSRGDTRTDSQGRAVVVVGPHWFELSARGLAYGRNR